MIPPLVTIDNLAVHFGVICAVRCPNLTIAPGEIVAVTGRSGAGKSTLGLAMLGLSAGRVSGTIEIQGRRITGAPESTLRPLRGKEIAWIPQDVAASLSPFSTIARQLTEVAETHAGTSYELALTHAINLLTRLRIDSANERIHEHPHHWSGGMLQRALIAMALMLTPSLIIADEPTAALDPEARAAFADLMRERASAGAGVLLMSHDRALVDSLASRTVRLG